MAKGTACSICRLVSLMMACKRSCACALACGAKRKPMPPPDIPPSIQKPQKSSPISRAHAADQRVGVEISGPGNNGLNGAVKIPLGGSAQAANVSVLQAAR